MAWLEITVDTAGRDTDDAAAALTARGFSDLVIEDEQELETFLDENRAYWDYIDEGLQKKLEGLQRIRLYLDSSDEAGMARLRQVCAQLGLPVSAKPLPETDWSESWKDNYPPQEVGKSLIVLPYWRGEEETSRHKIILDPGIAFGTGAHPSTQMVMEVMERTVKPGDKCLDLGSGSGILSITALLLGASHATGVDIDPKAEDIARENAAINGLGADRFTAVTGDVIADNAMMERLSGEYDLVLANIVADVIIPLSPLVPRFLKADGLFICSGILEQRLDEVKAAIIKAGLEIVSVRMIEDWCQITARLAQGG